MRKIVPEPLAVLLENELLDVMSPCHRSTPLQNHSKQSHSDRALNISRTTGVRKSSQKREKENKIAQSKY